MIASLVKKSCTKCGKMYPAEFSYFYRHDKKSDGLTSWCRKCYKEKDDLRYKEMIANGKKMKRGCPIRERERNRGYRAKNIDFYRLRERAYQAKRNKDYGYRLSQSVGRRIREVLNGCQKGGFRHLPYSREELIFHLERQFSPKMKWANYGSYWHIDHIRPLSSFNLTGHVDDEFLQCWSLSNLRPLEKTENMSKNAKTLFLI